LKEVDVWLTSRTATGAYNATLTIYVNGTALPVVGPVSLRVNTTRESVAVPFVLPSAVSISSGSSVRFQVLTTSSPSGGDLSWEGVTAANCPVISTQGTTGTAAVGRSPIRVIGTP